MSEKGQGKGHEEQIAAYTPPLEVIRRSLNQLTDHGSQKCLDCLHYRDQGMNALTQIESALERIATPARPDGTYNLGREAVAEQARELLDGTGRYQPRGIPHNRETTRTEEP